MITNDCVASFEDIHKIQVSATSQLSLLVEARERMNEVMEGIATPVATPAGTPQSKEGIVDSKRLGGRFDALSVNDGLMNNQGDTIDSDDTAVVSASVDE
jgi:hypothetical protein